MPRVASPRWGWRIADRAEIERPSYSDDDIQKLADCVGVSDPQDYARLRTDVEDVAVHYLALQHNFTKPPTPAEQKAALNKVTKDLCKILSTLERIDDFSGLAICGAASGKGIHNLDAMFGVESAAIAEGEERFEHAVNYMHQLSEFVDTAFGLIPDVRTGARPKIAFDGFVWALARVYEKWSEKPAEIKHDRISEKYRSHFFDFVVITLSRIPTERRRANTPLGKSVQRALVARPAPKH